MEQRIQQQLYTLNRLYKESDGIYRNIAGQFGLTDTAFWILYAITHSDEPCTQNDLSNDWSYPVQTINSAVANLQKKGLVRLEAIPGTRNRKEIILTEEGEQFVERIISKIDDIEKNAFLLFTEEERETYLSLFKRHLDNIKNERDIVINSINDIAKEK